MKLKGFKYVLFLRFAFDFVEARGQPLCDCIAEASKANLNCNRVEYLRTMRVNGANAQKRCLGARVRARPLSHRHYSSIFCFIEV